MSFCHDNNCLTNSSAIFTILDLRIYEFVMIYFSIVKLRQKACFGPIRNLFSFSTVQTDNKLWKKLVKASDEFVSRPSYDKNVNGICVIYIKIRQFSFCKYIFNLGRHQKLFIFQHDSFIGW